VVASIRDGYRQPQRHSVQDTGLPWVVVVGTELTTLQKLDLESTRVSDAGLEYLKGLPKLQSLDLFQTNVTNAGVKNIRKALPKVMISG
jgi:hypothetical protein